MIISIQHREWREWQEKFDDYKASLSFQGINELSDYLITEYKLDSDVRARLMETLMNRSSDNYLLDLPEEKYGDINLERFS